MLQEKDRDPRDDERAGEAPNERKRTKPGEQKRRQPQGDGAGSSLSPHVPPAADT